MQTSESDIALRLAALSTREIVDALGAAEAPAIARGLLERIARIPSARLGQSLARFDARTESVGLSQAAREVLTHFGASVVTLGACPARGAALVVVNHPGAYDALAIMAAIAREDIALLATDRAFLRAMPHVRRHLVFASVDGARARAQTARRAIDWLARGGVLVQFGAGEIEPDARFEPSKALATWKEGTGLLARRALRGGAAVIPAFVSGVHSARAKRLFFVKWAERRGVTTLAPLIQATLPGFRDVTVAIRFGQAIGGLADGNDDQRHADALREAVRILGAHDTTRSS